jgi:hypothetical protein
VGQFANHSCTGCSVHIFSDSQVNDMPKWAKNWRKKHRFSASVFPGCFLERFLVPCNKNHTTPSLLIYCSCVLVSVGAVKTCGPTCRAKRRRLQLPQVGAHVRPGRVCPCPSANKWPSSCRCAPPTQVNASANFP